MTISELIKALRRLKIQTNSFACLGCGHEHNCGIHGCAIIREAVHRLDDFYAFFNEEAVVRLAGRCLEVDPDRLRELAEADKEGRVVVLPCKVGDGLWTFCSHPVEQVYSFTVTSISTLNGRTMLNTSRCGVIDARDVGKTVFLTHKEAEKALEAMKDD